MTLTLAGYRFGESNHAVYLIDALRRVDPNVLSNDWWTRSTLQYHFVFTRLSAWLMKTGTIEPAFLAMYVALVVLLHVAWRSLTVALGGCDGVYLASVILFELLAGGTGLGMYQFLQDSSFLPSNIANVAMLWGIMFWVRGRPTYAGLALGITGLFHLNHALAGIGLWIGLALLGTLRRGHSEAARRWLLGTLLILALSSLSIVPALKTVLTRSASMPLREFVDLYVRLRHPHHYDPSSWPVALWLTFLVPIAVAVWVMRIAEASEPRRRAADAFILFMAMLSVALLGAGIYYVSEPLVQMSLYRFSIYPKLLSCIATAWLIWQYNLGQACLRFVIFAMLIAGTAALIVADRITLPPFVRANVFPIWLFALFASSALLRPRVLGWGRELFGTLASLCVIVSVVVSWHKLGIAHEGIRGDDAGYLEVCRWARDNTPVDAVFVVPPDEQSFRLQARRAIVVNFKNVPQLSGELGEWRDRLQNLLGVSDLRRALPRPFPRTLDALRDRYEKLPAQHLLDFARRYDARYVVTLHPLDARDAERLVFHDSGQHYFLYDLNR